MGSYCVVPGSQGDTRRVGRGRNERQSGVLDCPTIVWHRIAPYRTACLVLSHCRNISHCIESHCIALYRLVSYCIVSYPIVLFPTLHPPPTPTHITLSPPIVYLIPLATRPLTSTTHHIALHLPAATCRLSACVAVTDCYPSIAPHLPLPTSDLHLPPSSCRLPAVTAALSCCYCCRCCC